MWPLCRMKSWKLENAGQSAPISPSWPISAKESHGRSYLFSLHKHFPLLIPGLSLLHLWPHQFSPLSDMGGWQLAQAWNVLSPRLEFTTVCDIYSTKPASLIEEIKERKLFSWNKDLKMK